MFLKSGLCAILFLFFAPAAGADLLTQADDLYLQRADGSDGDRAQREPIAAAIATYQRAVDENPTHINTQWKLLRALFFQAQYTGYKRDERKKLFAEARDRAEDYLDLAAKTCGGKRIWEKGKRPQIAKHCNPDDAAQLYLWSAIAWAQWGRANGAMAAVRAGLAGRLRDYAERVIDLDSDCEQGGGQRLLAGLHARLPKIPFISGFVRKKKALPLAQQALAINPDYPGNRYLYATTLLKLQPERSEEARAILEVLAAEKPSGPERVEWQNLCDRAQRWLDGKYKP